MKVRLYLLLGLALLALASYRQFFDLNVTLDQRLRCEAMIHADHEGDLAGQQQLLPRCTRRAMVALMDARHEGADRQAPAEALEATRRQEALSALINLALTGAGIGALTAAWRCRQRARLVGKRP